MEGCIYCGSERSKLLFELRDIFLDKYQLRECENCETSFLHPKPNSDQLTRAYRDDYYGEGETKFNPLVERVIDFFRKRNAKKIAKIVNFKGRVLDIGCGNGKLLQNIGTCGNFELHGLELPSKSAERASKIKEIELHIGALKPETYLPNSFDLITLIHVFEHLENPKDIIEIIESIIKKNGILIVEFPNLASWQAKFFKQNWLHLDPPRHLNFFKPEQFKRILNQVGFVLIQEKYFSPQFSPFGVQQSILNTFLAKRDVLYEYLKGNKAYTKPYSRLNIQLQVIFHWLSFPFFIATDMIASFFKRGGTIRFIFKKND